MDWKIEAGRDLRDYAQRRASIRNLQEDIASMEAELTGLGSIGAETPVMSSGGGPDDRLLNLIVGIDLRRKSLQRAQTLVSMVDRCLALLDEDDRETLEKFYIRRMRVDAICEELRVERATAYRWRDRALRAYTLTRYGCIEPE